MKWGPEIWKKGLGVRTGVEEHVTNCRSLLVHLEWMSSKDDSFGYDTCSIWIQEATHGHEMWGYETMRPREKPPNQCGSVNGIILNWFPNMYGKGNILCSLSVAKPTEGGECETNLVGLVILEVKCKVGCHRQWDHRSSRRSLSHGGSSARIYEHYSDLYRPHECAGCRPGLRRNGVGQHTRSWDPESANWWLHASLEVETYL